MADRNTDERLTALETKMDSLLELREPLQIMSMAVTRHEEKWENLEEQVLPPMKDEIEKGKKFRWSAAAVGGFVATFFELAKQFWQNGGGNH